MFAPFVISKTSFFLSATVAIKKFWRLLIGCPLFEISQLMAQVRCSRDTQMSFLLGMKQPGDVIYLFFEIPHYGLSTMRCLVRFAKAQN